ncbi:hypothetical protein CTI12_AA207820 [Artemisia annua]|uniref:Remorin N-terminal domain-containing protein n=1 Tax=Artemisia annua TaxID=35608 RepID=A0A2U1P060_ARTAN|nr:hypothetical protein CTI12_AA207820 [Artemisia annua]
MDLLYEKEETSTLYSSPHSLAASILVASYVISVPKQRWEFPLLPWEPAEPVVEEKPSEGSVNRDAVLARVSTEKKESLIRAWEESEKSKAANKAE